MKSYADILSPWDEVWASWTLKGWSFLGSEWNHPTGNYCKGPIGDWVHLGTEIHINAIFYAKSVGKCPKHAKIKVKFSEHRQLIDTNKPGWKFAL